MRDKFDTRRRPERITVRFTTAEVELLQEAAKLNDGSYAHGERWGSVGRLVRDAALVFAAKLVEDRARSDRASSTGQTTRSSGRSDQSGRKGQTTEDLRGQTKGEGS